MRCARRRKEKGPRGAGRSPNGLEQQAGVEENRKEEGSARLGRQWATREGEKRKKRLGLCWAE